MIHKPHQDYCEKCQHLERHCDFDFSKMKPYTQKYAPYETLITLVQCKGYERRVKTKWDNKNEKVR
jgi:hypothetical protein